VTAPHRLSPRQEPPAQPGAVQLWEGADRLWRYRYVQSGSPRPILSNRGYPSKEEAIQSAELAYPGVPISQFLAPPERTGGRRTLRSMAKAAAVGGGATLILVGVTKLALAIRRTARRVRRLTGVVRVASTFLAQRRGGREERPGGRE